MAYHFLILLSLFWYFYICKSYTVNIRADRLVYHNNFNDTLIIYCILADEFKYVTASNITIHHVRNMKSSDEEIRKFISILNDTTIQLKIYNVQHSHSGVYFCANKSDNNYNNSVRVKIYVGEKPLIPNFIISWIDNKSLSGKFEPSCTQIQQNTKIPTFVGKIDFQLSFNFRSKEENNLWDTCDKKENSNSLCILNDAGFYLTKEYSAASYTFFSLRVNVTFGAPEFVQMFGYSTQILTYNYIDIFEPSEPGAVGALVEPKVNITTFARVISLQLPSASVSWLKMFFYRYRVTWSTSKGTLGQIEGLEKLQLNLRQLNLTQLTPNTCYNISISRRFVELKNETVTEPIGHWSDDLSMRVCTNMTVPEGPVSWPSFWWRAVAEKFEMWWDPFPDDDWHGDKDYYHIEMFDLRSQVVLERDNSTKTYYTWSSLTTRMLEPLGIAVRACNLMGCSLDRTQQVIPQHDMMLPEDLVRFDVEQVQMTSDSWLTFAIIVFVNFSGFAPNDRLNVSGYILSHNRVIDYESSSVNATAKVGSIRLIMSPVLLDATNNFLFSASLISTSSSGVLKSTGFVQFSPCVYAAPDSSSINRSPPSPSHSAHCGLDSSCVVSFQFRRIVCEDLTVGRVSFYEVQCVEEIAGRAMPVTANLSSDACRFTTFCELGVVLKQYSNYRYKIMAHLHNGQSIVYSDWINVTTTVRSGGDEDARFVLIGASVSAGLLALLALVLFGWYKRNFIKQIVKRYQFPPYKPNPKSVWSPKIEDRPATEDDNSSIKVTAASETGTASSYSSSGFGSGVGSISDYFKSLVTVTRHKTSFSEAGQSAITGYSGSLC